MARTHGLRRRIVHVAALVTVGVLLVVGYVTQPVLPMRPSTSAARADPARLRAHVEKLAAACAERKRWDFLFVSPALPIKRGTGSPLNPLAFL